MKNPLRLVLKNYKLGEAVLAELEDDLSFLVKYLPGFLGFLSRFLVYKLLCRRIAFMPYVFSNVRVTYMRRLSLGRGVVLNVNNYLYARGGIDIADNVLVGPNCVFVAGDHVIEADVLISETACRGERIEVGEGAWIGANCVITGGISIGEHCVIGAGSVVTKSTDPYGVYVGSPARKIRDRRAAEAPPPGGP